jgi:hypothetical protein
MLRSEYASLPAEEQSSFAQYEAARDAKIAEHLRDLPPFWYLQGGAEAARRALRAFYDLVSTMPDVVEAIRRGELTPAVHVPHFGTLYLGQRRPS